MSKIGQRILLICPFVVSGNACNGWIEATYTGTVVWEDVKIHQYMNCCCVHCGTERTEMFECCEGSAVGAEITDRFVLEDKAWKTHFRFNGIGLPFAEMVDPVSELMQAIDDRKRREILG